MPHKSEIMLIAKCSRCQHYLPFRWNKNLGKCAQRNTNSMTEAGKTCNWWGPK